MWLVAGLGNPGTQYAHTRHNIGFMAADALARRYSFTPFRPKMKGQIATGSIADDKVILIKPETFMNLSGEAVQAAGTFYRIGPDCTIVIHDDMDLPVGKVKVKRGGSAGGHNGLKSIDSKIGPDYLRVRIGIGRPDSKDQIVDWVLTPFPPQDQALIDETIDRVIDLFPLLMVGQESLFLNKIGSPK